MVTGSSVLRINICAENQPIANLQNVYAKKIVLSRNYHSKDYLRRKKGMAKVSEIIFYQGDDGIVKIEVFFHGETFWMTQKKISELFGVQRPVITKHLSKIFESGELHEESVSSILGHTAVDGKNYKTTFYNLDAIIAVGYRVNSNKSTKFRIWATKVLNEFVTKGFVLDDERLKQGKHFGKDYFVELLERIREIRASERRFYQKKTLNLQLIDY